MEIKNHLVKSVDVTQDLHVYRQGQSGPGGAFQTYRLSAKEGNYDAFHCILEFKRIDSGHKGVTNEALLAVVEDRLQAFQQSEFCCAENAEALEHVAKALAALKSRTLRRIAEGTEGQLVEKGQAPPTPAPPQTQAAAEPAVMKEATATSPEPSAAPQDAAVAPSPEEPAQPATPAPVGRRRGSAPVAKD